MKRFALSLALVGLVVVPSLPAWAQAGWYVVPSLSISEEFDDNVFSSTSDRKSDFITRVSPRLTAGYQSAPLTLLGSYSFDAELYADNSDLNGINRHRADLDFRAVPDPVLTLGLTASYVRSDTTTPLLQPSGAGDVVSGAPSGGEPVPGATPPGGATTTPSAPPGVPTTDLGRTQSTQYRVSPRLSYAATARLALEGQYTYSRSEVSGADPEVEHEGMAAGRYQLTQLDAAFVRYRLRMFEDPDSETSHAVTLGWARSLAPQTSLSLEAGPRITGSDVGIEASASLAHQFQYATLTITYARGEGIVVGRSGSQTTDTVALSLVAPLTRALSGSLVGTFLRASSATAGDALTSDDVRVYAVTASLGYRVTDWLAVRLAYGFSYQDQTQAVIRHHVVSVSLDFAYPLRVD